MKSTLVITLLFLASLAFAQSEAKPAAPSEADKSFDTMKSLAGKWLGGVTVDPPQHEMGNANMEVSLRVTSRGNALVHEMKGATDPDDPNKYDHPVTMMYRENDQLLLTHYCDAGNRPRMAGKVSPDGKKVEFEFLDISGSNKFGHMNHAVFTVIDANHHLEDWTYMTPGDKPIHAHFDLQRAR
jgi:hypothetical protein